MKPQIIKKSWLRNLDPPKQKIILENQLSLVHTPVYGLLKQERGTAELWTTEDGKIGMDGGAVYGGVFMGLSLLTKE